MSARIIDGKAIAANLRARVAAESALVQAAHGLTPGLAVILVGDDPASAIYVKSKSKAAREAGFNTFDTRHDANLSQERLLAEIAALNANPSVHGILVQLPLPQAIDPTRIIDAIDPLKDVDGLNPFNAGRLLNGEFGPKHGLIACTPLGCLFLIKHALGPEIGGRNALVIGRSSLVGKPMAQLLLAENCTVTMAHSKTRDLPECCRRADILVAATGQGEMVRGDWIKKGGVVIDVGISRKSLPDGGSRLVGDVAFDEAKEVAGWITPVPGGVGPMTIACLMRNTLVAAAMQAGLPVPPV